jgi:hypothetical protein
VYQGLWQSTTWRHPLDPGSWESSGVLDASKLYGKDWWLLDVQAHTQTHPSPGLTWRPPG